MMPTSRTWPLLIALAVAPLGCWTAGAKAPAAPAVAQAPASTPTPAPSPSSPAAGAAPPAADAPLTQAHCEVSTSPPVRATAAAEIEVVLPRGDRLVGVSLRSSGPDHETSAVQMGTSLPTHMTISPGTYTIELQTARGARVQCPELDAAAGSLTTLRILTGVRA